ncbi:hypothetical protein FBU30_007141 [Linnemannia zychae]|nr:hypothetical protein FBU30_007141 [Linnemannia zychae]
MAPTTTDQQRLWESFKQRFSHATTLIEYIERNWLQEHLERWVVFHRKEGQEVTTNKVESWHKILKQKYLSYEHNVRADRLLYLLQVALDNFRVEYLKTKHGIAAPLLSKDDRLRKKRAALVPLDQALSLVTPMVDNKKVFDFHA